MFRGSRARARIAFFVATSMLVPVVVGATSTSARAESAASPRAASPSFVGPLISHAENATTSWGRDGGITVPLPNGRDFWIFGDTPRYQYVSGKWKLNAFIYGSSGGEIAYTSGRKPSGQFSEVVPRRAVSARNQPSQLLPSPSLYIPDGSGRACNKANGGPSTGANRWPTGAALMPDKTNVLIPYIGVCVINATKFTAESWGFALFNWKTTRFSAVKDVWKPKKSGASIPPILNRGSPIISGSKVTFFSGDCCTQKSHTYATAVPANVSALSRQSSYSPRAIAHLYPSPNMAVVAASKTQRHLTMYQMVDSRGRYRLLKASKPTGPWSVLSSGVLPRCNRGYQCISVELHPELSTASKMLVSYYQPDFGPGVATKHPHPHPPLGHVVLAYLPG